MSYISFVKGQLINLEFSLGRELVRSNRSGGYSSTTIAGCNTRKYHGLLVVPQPWFDHDNHVLLSSIDETIIQHDEQFNFGVRMYPNGVFDPRGHKYLREFYAEPIPRLIYRVGGVVLSKEMIFAENESRILIKYTLLDAHSRTILRLKPFLAFRNVHQLSKANINLNNKFEDAQNGKSWQLYSGYSRLYFQLSKECEYTHIPDWYYNVEYIREKERGFPSHEDLFVPGFFEVELKKGESVIVSAGLEEKQPTTFNRQFSAESNKRTPRNNFENCLINSAEQFIVRDKKKAEIMAGFPWFGTWGRDTFIALPGLTLLRGAEADFKAVIDTALSNMQGPLFPNIGHNNKPDYSSVDAPLWFFWSMQQYTILKGNHSEIWKTYKKKFQLILNGYKQGTDFNIKMNDNGLIYAGGTGMALTWMDVVSNGKPVTPRTGLAVEINALWYNAVCFAVELAGKAGDKAFVNEWKSWPEKIKTSFVATFWDSTKGYLADYVNDTEVNWTVRPNMLFAVSLPYSPLNDDMQIQVLNKVKSELLTERGLRSLTPTDENYVGNLTGNQLERDQAYHQGTVFPWLIGPFCEAWLKLHGKSGVSLVDEIYHGFESTLLEAGIGNISEVYDGNPPHDPRGGISQAWNVAALLTVRKMLDDMSENTNNSIK
jgi:predicted glycogen debranching enzyme